MSELPLTWSTPTLREIARVEMGQSPDSRFYNETGEGVPFFQGKAEFGKLHPKVRKWCTEPTKLAQAGDILLSIRAPVGPTNIADVECCIGRGLAAIRARSPLHQSYLHQFFRHIEPWLSKQGTGTTFAAVSGDFLRQIEVAVAPLAEQKRIAEKLEAVLRRVDACRARLDRVPALLKRFRQSVLAAATSGQLTEDWREENESNVEWEDVELGALMESKPRNGYSPRSVEFETPTKSLTLTATTSGRFRGEHSKFIDETIPPSSHLWLIPGDILIQRANTIEYVGVSAIFDGQPGKFIYPDLMMKCRANGRTTSGFLHLLLQSEGVRRYFRENATGTAGNMPKINQGTVMTAPAKLPPLPEQTEIVRRVEALFAMADRIEARLSSAQKTVERLTPAVLAKAFRGELVPQDPNDEPASALLERLRSSQSAAPTSKKPRQQGNGKRPRAPKETAAMTKSRFDEDVKGKPYLAGFIGGPGYALTAEQLFQTAQLSLVDFYKQLAWEVEQGMIKENGEELEVGP